MREQPSFGALQPLQSFSTLAFACRLIDVSTWGKEKEAAEKGMVAALLNTNAFLRALLGGKCVDKVATM